MKSTTALLVMIFAIASFFFVRDVGATNGNQLVGASPAALSMGGTGIALPQDFTSAVFSNPASIGSSLRDKGYELEFASIAAFPKTQTKITVGGSTYKGSNTDDLLAIPSASLKLPIERWFPRWSAGVAVGGVAGIKVDYRGSSLDRPTHYLGMLPMSKGLMAELEVSKLAPSLAVRIVEGLSIGVALHLDRASLDLGDGASWDNEVGMQAGILYSINDRGFLGATYISPQAFTFKEVSDLDGDTLPDTLVLEMPQELGLGVGVVLFQKKMLLEADLKWKDWSDAKGYKELDWNDQWVFALGARYNATEKLALMAGYNYAESPVNVHKNFVGPALVDVQGKKLPGYYYETFRIVGNPAVEEHHASFGLAYELTDWLMMQLNYTHVFREKIEQSGTDLLGAPVTIESSAGADAFAFGIVSRF